MTMMKMMRMKKILKRRMKIMSGTFKESYIIYTYTYLCYRLIMNIFKHQYVFTSHHLDVFEISLSYSVFCGSLTLSA